MSTIYKVAAGDQQRWAGSMAQVREHTKELMDDHGFKRKEVAHEELEIEFSKSGVLAFLNEHATATSPSGDVEAEED